MKCFFIATCIYTSCKGGDYTIIAVYVDVSTAFLNGDIEEEIFMQFLQKWGPSGYFPSGGSQKNCLQIMFSPFKNVLEPAG
jgi:hypothetical protein